MREVYVCEVMREVSSFACAGASNNVILMVAKRPEDLLLCSRRSPGPEKQVLRRFAPSG
jgi:hypothetical protein